MPNPDRKWRWSVLTVSALVIGAVVLVVEGIRGHWADGLTALIVLLAFAEVTTLLGARSEAAALLSGAEDDERHTHIKLQSAATTGRILSLVIFGGYLWTLQTHNGAAPVFGGLEAVAGSSVILTTAWHTRRG